MKAFWRKQDGNKVDTAIAIFGEMAKKVAALSEAVQSQTHELTGALNSMRRDHFEMNKKLLEVIVELSKKDHTTKPQTPENMMISMFEELPLASKEGYTQEELGVGSEYQESA